MIAVIATGGKQYLVKPGMTLKVEKLGGEAGGEIIFDKVLLLADEAGGEVKLGAPFLSGVSVIGIIEAQGRNKKIRVVKYKRKVRYKRVHGHRQAFTKVKIKEVK